MPTDTTKTDIALLKQEIQYVKESVGRLESSTSSQHAELKQMMKDFIDSANDNFATKEEHKSNSKRIEDLEADRRKVIGYIIGTATIIILVFTGIEKLLQP